jgi:hypothetical protein
MLVSDPVPGRIPKIVGPNTTFAPKKEFSSGVTEGLNNKAKTQVTPGFRTCGY